MARYLDPKTDIVFKKIFGQHPQLLKSFLNAVLPLPENGLIDSLEYLSSEQVPAIPTFKYTVVDISLYRSARPGIYRRNANSDGPPALCSACYLMPVRLMSISWKKERTIICSNPFMA